MNKKLLLSIREHLMKSKLKNKQLLVVFNLDKMLLDITGSSTSKGPNPIFENIAVVNKLFREGLTIVLQTSKKADYSDDLVLKLRRLRIKYTAINFNKKMDFDVLVDKKERPKPIKPQK